MMTCAYDEMYLQNAMDNLGTMMEYISKNTNMKKEEFFRLFIAAGIAEEFEKGNPKYVAGFSGIELAYEVFDKSGKKEFTIECEKPIHRNADYWCGWILAYYQWKTGKSFKDISRTLSFSEIEKMYETFHEAPEMKFVENVNRMVQEKNMPTKLQEQRKKYGISQTELAQKSGVSLRSIQMYEQRQKKIDHAQAITLSNLAKTLGCKITDLFEYEK